MSNAPNNMEAYILAGGKSSRMGTDKGLLLFRGIALIERVIAQLRPLFNKIVIVSNNPEYGRFGLEVIEDMIRDKGPAGGIHAALTNTTSDKVFIVSCDMPFITSAAVEHIIRHQINSQITIPSYKGTSQPLFGLYSKDCVSQWEQLIKQKIIKLQEMVNHFDLLKMDTDHEHEFNDILFTNINDKNDLTQALQQL